jgi:hypothetical protein
MISFRDFAHGDLHIAGARGFEKLKRPWGADIGLDSEVASETSADWRWVVTRAYQLLQQTYPAFALPVSDGFDGG